MISERQEWLHGLTESNLVATSMSPKYSRYYTNVTPFSTSNVNHITFASKSYRRRVAVGTATTTNPPLTMAGNGVHKPLHFARVKLEKV
jgi:hypothetical protein